MKEINIRGANRFDTYTKTRAASRAVIIRGDDILLSYMKSEDTYMIPGGGAENGESPEECCIREAEEETGLIVKPTRLFLTVNEFYEEYRYISCYFICEIAGISTSHLTEAEMRAGLVPEWVPLAKAVQIFSHHNDLAGTYEEKRGLYQREYTALTEYMKL
ncbi:MAG: NUDIX domain-containing protein [Oscillospiraceae bacterium]|nr:NUDIX domain-containing protein [Oscillospiraceae bacterium]